MPSCMRYHTSLDGSCEDKMHRWARFLKQQTLITVDHLATKEIELPLSATICTKQTCVCVWEGGCVWEWVCVYIYIYIYIAVSTGERKHRRFSSIYSPYAHRTNGSYPFAKGLNGPIGLAHLWQDVSFFSQIFLLLFAFIVFVTLEAVIRNSLLTFRYAMN